MIMEKIFQIVQLAPSRSSQSAWIFSCHEHAQDTIYLSATRQRDKLRHKAVSMDEGDDKSFVLTTMEAAQATQSGNHRSLHELLKTDHTYLRESVILSRGSSSLLTFCTDEGTFTEKAIHEVSRGLLHSARTTLQAVPDVSLLLNR